MLFRSAVYVPTVPSTPLLRNKGEVEITAALRGLSSLEAGAAWSPAPQLLVAGEAALQSSEGSETRNNVTTAYRNFHRQAGLGIGTYRLLGPDQSLYLGALGGIGLATARVYDSNIDLLFFTAPVQYQARYLRYYGQLYLAQQGPRVSYGFSVRGTFVDYRKLLRDGAPIEPLSRFFLEPTLFLRVGRGALQGVATIGISLPNRRDPQNPDNPNLSPSSTLVSAGVVLRPHFLRPRNPPVPPQ